MTMSFLEVSRANIVRVTPAEVPGTAPAGLWPCSGCGQGYPVHEGWLIDYYHTPTHEAARAYVCADCAGQAETFRASGRPD